jgi:hypothetical protein
MPGATKPRLAAVFLMILTLGVSLSLPAEDVLDTVCDESEALACEVIPLFSIMVGQVAARTTQAPLNSFLPKLGAPSKVAPACVRNSDASRSADARALSAQLCILLC